MIRRFSLLALLAAFASPAFALEWQADKQEFTTKPFQATQEVVFTFKNTATKTVNLLDLQTNCDCLRATADLPAYAPGATGTIKARFTIGDRSGLYERFITVVTDETSSPVRLLVRFEVPEIAALTPRSVSWHLQAEPAEKIVELIPAAGLEIDFREAQATNDAFIVRLETVVAGKHFRLHLQPRSTADSASAAIRIFGREQAGHDVVVSAYASVQ
jgi:hypothetical protein